MFFMDMGYNVLLVDFMGAGNSEGNNITVGYKEAENVQACYEYIKETGEDNIYLFGTSMGAVAILKAINDDAAHPKAIIIECPYGTMMETVEARFKMVHFPTFPMAGLFVFWGGILNGFWGFSLNPQEFAKAVKCPTLLLYGAKDDRVSMKETKTIFRNLCGPKVLKIYPDASHENYLKKYPGEWAKDVARFLDGSRK
jgi:alpha-beta hydrolase superfamily lysophospholipase